MAKKSIGELLAEGSPEKYLHTRLPRYLTVEFFKNLGFALVGMVPLFGNVIALIWLILRIQDKYNIANHGPNEKTALYGINDARNFNASKVYPNIINFNLYRFFVRGNSATIFTILFW